MVTGNMLYYGGDGLSIPYSGRSIATVAILVVALCYRNLVKVHLCGPLGILSATLPFNQKFKFFLIVHDQCGNRLNLFRPASTDDFCKAFNTIADCCSYFKHTWAKHHS